jgi:hypothetical protein
MCCELSVRVVQVSGLHNIAEQVAVVTESVYSNLMPLHCISVRHNILLSEFNGTVETLDFAGGGLFASDPVQAYHQWLLTHAGQGSSSSLGTVAMDITETDVVEEEATGDIPVIDLSAAAEVIPPAPVWPPPTQCQGPPPPADLPSPWVIEPAVAPSPPVILPPAAVSELPLLTVIEEPSMRDEEDVIGAGHGLVDVALGSASDPPTSVAVAVSVALAAAAATDAAPALALVIPDVVMQAPPLGEEPHTPTEVFEEEDEEIEEEGVEDHHSPEDVHPPFRATPPSGVDYENAALDRAGYDSDVDMGQVIIFINHQV